MFKPGYHFCNHSFSYILQIQLWTAESHGTFQDHRTHRVHLVAKASWQFKEDNLHLFYSSKEIYHNFIGKFAQTTGPWLKHSHLTTGCLLVALDNYHIFYHWIFLNLALQKPQNLYRHNSFISKRQLLVWVNSNHSRISYRNHYVLGAYRCYHCYCHIVLQNSYSLRLAA